jgi:predicted RNA methylase
MREPDLVFADPRFAVLYDILDPDRSDLDVYAAIVDELGASSVIDIGCGTGSLAVLLAGTLSCATRGLRDPTHR